MKTTPTALKEEGGRLLRTQLQLTIHILQLLDVICNAGVHQNIFHIAEKAVNL
jgi:hypothetical protein